GDEGRLTPTVYFQAEDGIRVRNVTGVQTCALPISPTSRSSQPVCVPWPTSCPEPCEKWRDCTPTTARSPTCPPKGYAREWKHSEAHPSTTHTTRHTRARSSGTCATNTQNWNCTAPTRSCTPTNSTWPVTTARTHPRASVTGPVSNTYVNGHRSWTTPWPPSIAYRHRWPAPYGRPSRGPPRTFPTTHPTTCVKQPCP